MSNEGAGVQIFATSPVASVFDVCSMIGASTNFRTGHPNRVEPQPGVGIDEYAPQDVRARPEHSNRVRSRAGLVPDPVRPAQNSGAHARDWISTARSASSRTETDVLNSTTERQRLYTVGIA